MGEPRASLGRAQLDDHGVAVRRGPGPSGGREPGGHGHGPRARRRRWATPALPAGGGRPARGGRGRRRQHRAQRRLRLRGRRPHGGGRGAGPAGGAGAVHGGGGGAHRRRVGAGRPRARLGADRLGGDPPPPDANGNLVAASDGRRLRYDVRDHCVRAAARGGRRRPLVYHGTGQIERTLAGATTFTNRLLGVELGDHHRGDDPLPARTPDGRVLGQATPTAAAGTWPTRSARSWRSPTPPARADRLRLREYTYGSDLAFPVHCVFAGANRHPEAVRAGAVQRWGCATTTLTPRPLDPAGSRWPCSWRATPATSRCATGCATSTATR